MCAKAHNPKGLEYGGTICFMCGARCHWSLVRSDHGLLFAFESTCFSLEQVVVLSGHVWSSVLKCSSVYRFLFVFESTGFQCHSLAKNERSNFTCDVEANVLTYLMNRLQSGEQMKS